VQWSTCIRKFLKLHQGSLRCMATSWKKRSEWFSSWPLFVFQFILCCLYYCPKVESAKKSRDSNKVNDAGLYKHCLTYQISSCHWHLMTMYCRK
jgi:hypothetical protein